MDGGAGRGEGLGGYGRTGTTYAVLVWGLSKPGLPLATLSMLVRSLVLVS